MLGHFVVAPGGGRREVVQPFDLLSAQLDAVGSCVLLDAGNPLPLLHLRLRTSRDSNQALLIQRSRSNQPNSSNLLPYTRVRVTPCWTALCAEEVS